MIALVTRSEPPAYFVLALSVDLSDAASDSVRYRSRRP